jgi:hypothetical protein
MRKILSIILGAIIASIILFLVGMIANSLQPTPPELMDPQTPQAVAKRVAATTSLTWISTIFGLSLGAFVGGIAGSIIAKGHVKWVSLGIGILLSLWAFYTFYIVYPKVLWVPFVMLICVFLFSYLGGALAGKTKEL